MTREQILDAVRDGLSHFPEYDGPDNRRDEFTDPQELGKITIEALEEWTETLHIDFGHVPAPDGYETNDWTPAAFFELLLHLSEYLLFLASRIPDVHQREAMEERASKVWSTIFVPYDPDAPASLREV